MSAASTGYEIQVQVHPEFIETDKEMVVEGDSGDGDGVGEGGEDGGDGGGGKEITIAPPVAHSAGSIELPVKYRTFLTTCDTTGKR